MSSLAARINGLRRKALERDDSFCLVSESDLKQPISSLLLRVKTIHSDLQAIFDVCSPPYIGKTTNIEARFADHRRDRGADDVAVIVISLCVVHEETALFIEHELHRALLDAGVPTENVVAPFFAPGPLSGRDAHVYVRFALKNTPPPAHERIIPELQALGEKVGGSLKSHVSHIIDLAQEILGGTVGR